MEEIPNQSGIHVLHRGSKSKDVGSAGAHKPSQSKIVSAILLIEGSHYVQ